MNCEQAKPVLLESLLEKSPAENREAIRLHLETCASCSDEMAALRQTLDLVRRAEVSEEIPQRIRLVAEPLTRWQAFWRDGARVAFAGAGLACLAIGLLALFQTTVSYESGNMEIAFGAAADRDPGAQLSAAATAPAALDRAQVLQLIAEAVAASEVKHQAESARLAQTVTEQTDEKRLRDLREMAERFRYFEAAQTMVYKEQVQNQHLVATLMRQVGINPAAQP